VCARIHIHTYKHKTGINNKKQGQPIIVSLKQYPDIAKNMDELAKTKDIIFNKEYLLL
jgi:hypothetical protein